MDSEIKLSVNLPTDDEGMIGRECPQCKQYFKVKPGTGLADISTCTCPYCERIDESDEFWTKAQCKYLGSIAIHEAFGPSLHELERTFKELERSTRHSLVSFKVKTKGFDLPLEYYSEVDLETTIVCENCGLVFAVFGVFATCPDCARLTAMSIFRKSIEVARKRLGLLSRIPAHESEIQQALITDALSAAVSTFDSLGKRLQRDFPAALPERPRNLFQNLDALSEVLFKNKSINIRDLVGADSYTKIYHLFQVRHIWLHNFGEVDEDFIKKTGVDRSLLRTKIVPSEKEIKEFLALVESLGVNLRKELQERA